MKTDAILKINKIGKISSSITLVCKIFVCIALFFTLLGAIFCLQISKSNFSLSTSGIVIANANFGKLYSFDAESIVRLQEALTGGSLSIEIGNQKYSTNTDVTVNDSSLQVTATSKPLKITFLDIAGVFLIGIVSLTMTLITLFFIGSLCKAFRDCASPFEESVIKKMQSFAFSLIPWAVISTVTNGIAEGLFSNKFSLNFTIDLGVVLLVLIVLVLVYIFKYGAILQQESDETL